MDRLKKMKETLVDCVQTQMKCLDAVDTKELSEAIDMIKDLSETIYYCTIVQSMEGDYHPLRDMDKTEGRMYYDDKENIITDRKLPVRYYTEREMPFGEMMRDSREGRSPMNRKMYMESKHMHKDKQTQMHELEKYVQELTNDLVEMVEDASPEEKQLLSNRIATLATKIK